MSVAVDIKGPAPIEGAVAVEGAAPYIPYDVRVVPPQPPYYAGPVEGEIPMAPAYPYGQPVITGRERYLPAMPQISSVHTSTQPCMFEHQIGKGPGFWKWKCERTVQPGVKKCSLVRVEKDQSMLVPMNCRQEYVNVLKGYDVQQQRIPMADGQVIRRQIVTPEVAVIGNVRKLGPAGPGIPVRMTAEQQTMLETRQAALQADYPYGQLVSQGETVMFGGRGAGRNRQRAPRDGGQASQGGRASQGDEGRAAVGGRIRLPSRTFARAKDVQFGPEDIQNFELGSLPGVIREPDQYAQLAQIGQNEIAFYTQDDSYGTTNMRHRTFGFTFSFRHLPYAYMTQQKYLEWLVSLSYRLRHEWSQFHHHVYDPLKDTIATMESYIMVTLGRLEAADKFFNRKELFSGAGEFKMVMHPILAAYAFRPPQRTWYSPLSARYLEGATGTEANAIANLGVLIGQITSQMRQAPLEVTDDAINFDAADGTIMAIVEDTLMALLARLQFLHGYVVNTHVVGQDLVRQLLATVDVGQRRYLTKELARYLEMFQMDDEGTPLHYLPALRLRQAQEQGLVVPRIPPQSLAATAVQLPLPLAVPYPQQRPDEYQRIVNPPAVTVLPQPVDMSPAPFVAPGVVVGPFGGAQQSRQPARKQQ